MAVGAHIVEACDEQPERLRSGPQRAVVRAANDTDPPRELADDECEGVAQTILCRVGAEQHPTSLAPHTLARALGLRLSASAPSGCRGALAPATRVLRYDGRGEPEDVSRRVAHELGHLAARDAGLQGLHPEGSVDRIAAAIVLPRAAVRRALQRVGFDPLRLLGELQGPPPAWTLLRAAWVAERAIVVHLGGERWAYAPDGRPPPRPGVLERELLAIVKRTGHRYETFTGDQAWPVGFREHPGVVILPRG